MALPLLAMLYLAPGGAAGAGPPETVLVVSPGGREVVAEVVRTAEARARGLMFRDELPEGQGMLFLFSSPGHHSFWMKNVRIPLDILWLDEQGRIVHLEKSLPPCKADPCPDYTPLRAARYVLELPGGQSERWGLVAGDRLEFIPALR